MSRPVVGTREDAWNEWDGAVRRAQALSWNLTRWTGCLLSGHWERHAKRVAELDRALWGPTADLLSADRVTRAVKVASKWDEAVVKCGLLDFIQELEHEAKTTARLGDVVAGWTWEVEGARDALANACVELLATTLVQVGGGPRHRPRAQAPSELT
jgi:hypothetical protein